MLRDILVDFLYSTYGVFEMFVIVTLSNFVTTSWLKETSRRFTLH